MDSITFWLLFEDWVVTISHPIHWTYTGRCTPVGASYGDIGSGGLELLRLLERQLQWLQRYSVGSHGLPFLSTSRDALS